MTTELARRTDLLPDTNTWATMLQMAGALVESGMLPSTIKTAQAAVAIIQKGQELRIPPMYALSNISVINGKPVTGAELMLAMIYRDHGDNAIQFEETTSERCVVLYKRRGWAQARKFEWTLEDAKRAGLLGKGGTWAQYPATMLRHRSVSAVARLAFPDTIGGMHTHEEMGIEVTINDQEEVVPVQAPPAAMTVVTVEPTPIDAKPKKVPLTREEWDARLQAGLAHAKGLGLDVDDIPSDGLSDDAVKATIRNLGEMVRAEIEARKQKAANVAAEDTAPF